jgi:NitT/TauT family transport system substrate-binding protein
MFNRILSTIAVILAVTTVANATEIKFNRHLKYTTTEPLLYKMTDILPKIAEKHGIKDLKISFVDIQEDPVAVQEMLAGNVDVIYGGVSSFAYAWNKDPSKVKLLAGAETFDMWLVCSNPNIKTMADIKPDTKITIKGLNSGDHMMLRQYSIAAYGPKESEKLNSNIVIVPRDQAFALHSADKPTVDCGIIGSPYQNQLVNSGKAHIVARPDNKKVYGFANSIYTTAKWADANPKLVAALLEAEKLAIEEYNKNPIPTLEDFIKRDGLTNVTAEEVAKMKKENNDSYITTLVPSYATLKLMYATGMIEGPNSSLPDSEMTYHAKH